MIDFKKKFKFLLKSTCKINYCYYICSRKERIFVMKF